MAFTVSHFSKRIVVLGFAPPLNKSSDVVRDILHAVRNCAFLNI